MLMGVWERDCDRSGAGRSGNSLITAMVWCPVSRRCVGWYVFPAIVVCTVIVQSPLLDAWVGFGASLAADVEDSREIDVEGAALVIPSNGSNEMLAAGIEMPPVLGVPRTRSAKARAPATHDLLTGERAILAMTGRKSIAGLKFAGTRDNGDVEVYINARE